MGWKTYLVVYFGTDNGSTMTEVVKKVESTGFTTTIGPVDFIYDWGNKVPTKEDICQIGDKLVRVLRGTGAVFNLDTHN